GTRSRFSRRRRALDPFTVSGRLTDRSQPRLLARHPQHEFRAGPRLRLQRPTEALYHAPGDGEPHSHPSPRSLGGEERGEDPLRILRTDAGTVVLHCEEKVLFLARAAHTHAPA